MSITYVDIAINNQDDDDDPQITIEKRTLRTLLRIEMLLARMVDNAESQS